MKYALNLSDKYRILSATYEQYATEDMVLVDILPEGDISNYQYIDGEYIYNPLPIQTIPEPGPSPMELIDAFLGLS